MTGYAKRLTCAAAVTLLAAGCGQARTGTALPKGDDVTAYVGGKFEQAMGTLKDKLKDTRDVTSSLDRYFRIDEKSTHVTLTTTRQGSPENLAFSNRAVRNPDQVLDTFRPGQGTVEYTYLGAAYRSLEPTPWISMPKPNDGLLINPCNWVGLITPCRMSNAAFAAYKADRRAVKGARTAGDGKTELTIEVPLGTFLDEQVMSLPPKLQDRIGDTLKKSTIAAVITLNPDGSPASVTMNAKMDGNGHEVELNLAFKFTGKATARDLPKLPDPSQVTVLDQAGTDDYYRRLGELQDASG